MFRYVGRVECAVMNKLDVLTWDKVLTCQECGTENLVTKGQGLVCCECEQPLTEKEK